jgi:hypothetical protein
LLIYSIRYHRKIDATKRYCIKSLSEILIFNLKRFDFDFNQGIKIKLNDYFSFPTYVNMLPWTQQGLNSNIPEGMKLFIIEESILMMCTLMLSELTLFLIKFYYKTGEITQHRSVKDGSLM